MDARIDDLGDQGHDFVQVSRQSEVSDAGEYPNIEVHGSPHGRCESVGWKEPVVLSHTNNTRHFRATSQYVGRQRRRSQRRAAAGGHQSHPLHLGLGRVHAWSNERPEHAASVIPLWAAAATQPTAQPVSDQP